MHNIGKACTQVLQTQEEDRLGSTGVESLGQRAREELARGKRGN